MARSQQPRFEAAGGHRLPLGGLNGYLGVRGKQGRNKNKFQGVTPKKVHRTKLFDTPLEAAIAFGIGREAWAHKDYRTPWEATHGDRTGFGAPFRRQNTGHVAKGWAPSVQWGRPCQGDAAAGGGT